LKRLDAASIKIKARGASSKLDGLARELDAATAAAKDWAAVNPFVSSFIGEPEPALALRSVDFAAALRKIGVDLQKA
jgi:hypothetical protein